MIKRFLALLCCLLLAASVAQAAIDWPVLTTQGQQAAADLHCSGKCQLEQPGCCKHQQFV